MNNKAQSIVQYNMEVSKGYYRQLHSNVSNLGMDFLLVK